MLGARYDGHPWNTACGSVINEDPSFPATQHFPAVFTFTDEFYQAKDYSRDKIRVLLRLDVSKMPKNAEVHRTDGDFPLAWAKTYGKGRVFYSALGHARATWDNPDVYRMYFEALKWSLRAHRGRCGAAPVQAVGVVTAQSAPTRRRASRCHEPRIVPQRIEPRVDLDRRSGRTNDRRPPCASHWKPRPTRAEREMDPGELERRHVALVRVGLELAQDVQRLLPAARQRERPAQRAVHPRRLRRQVHGALKRRRRLVEVLPLLLNDAENPVGRREVRVELDRVIALLERRLEVAPVEVNHREVARHD